MKIPVLLVEDNVHVRDRLRFDLEDTNKLDVTAVGTVKEAVEKLQSPPIPAWRAVVVDMKLNTPPRGHPELTDFKDIHPDGFALARRIRRDWPNIAVFGLTGFIDEISLSCSEWFRESGDPSKSVGVYDKARQWVLLRHHLLKLAGQAPTVKVFIVHGHDDETKEELAAYAKALGWEPKILGRAERQGYTWIDLFEKESRQASLAWIVFTPDEWGCPVNLDLKRNLKPGLRPRPNVTFECGYFFGAFGRLSQRVLLFKKGDVELPSDLDGIARGVHLRGKVSDADADIRRELGPWL